MCGINGFSFKDELRIKAMNQAIEHRGPDDQGIFTNDQVSLGHLRLAIIDLSPAGHQPMSYLHEKNQPVIVFNGEIYNYQDVRQELIAKGYRFKSKSDTEVILAAYLEYGFDCVKHFNGMWAFCIYDPAKQVLFLSRDRLGVKPLYFYHKDKTLIFSSEIKGILAHTSLGLNRASNINEDAVDYFFSIGFIPSPHTIFKDVYKLEPRQNLTFSLKTGQLERWHYYEIPRYQPEDNKQRLIKEGRDLLRDAIRLRLIADVPVGAFLSGGLDSSCVVGLMSEYTDLEKLHTFSIGFSGKFDESPYINMVKNYFHTKHHHSYFKDEDFPPTLKQYQNFFDEPLCDFGFLPSFKVCGEARQQVTVALTGDGGDEIFAGYGSFANVLQYQTIRQVPKPFRQALLATINLFKKESDWTLLGKIRELLRWSLTDTINPLKELYPQNRYLGEPSRRWFNQTLQECWEKTGNIVEANRYHSLFYLSMGDNFLTKTDRASMAYALEARSPFCDYRWVEFSARIPVKWKVNLRGGTKLLMREIIKDVVPTAILTRGKQGFTPPFYLYVEKNAEQIASYVDTIISKKLLPPPLQNILDNHQPKNKLYLDTLLKGYLFALWYERWVQPTSQPTPKPIGRGAGSNAKASYSA